MKVPETRVLQAGCGYSPVKIYGNDKMSLVSIIIPCWNAQDTVSEAIESALAQRSSSFEVEIIAVDDGSTDNTLEIIRSFDHKIQYIASSHQGACAARNSGLTKASGNFLQFLDADDYLMEEKVARQARMLAESGATFVAGSYCREHRASKDRTCKQLQSLDPWVALLRGGGRLGNTCSNLWRTSEIKSIGGWNVDWQSSQEAELMFRLLQSGADVAWDSEPLTVVRSRENSISNISGPRLKPSAWRNWVMVREQIVEYLAAQGELTEDRLAAFQQTLIRLARNYRRQDGEEARSVIRRNNAWMKSTRMIKGHFLYGLIFDVFGFEMAESCRDVYGRIRAQAIPYDVTHSRAG